MVALLASACSKSSDNKSAPAAGSSAPAAPAAAPGAEGYEGKLVTSGFFAGTWTVAPGSDASPFNGVNAPSLKSDREPWGNLTVKEDGSVSFGSAAKEFPGGQLKGTGAKVTLDKSGKFVCAFSVDTDLVSTRGGPGLHLQGAMTVHWHPAGLDGCP